VYKHLEINYVPGHNPDLVVKIPTLERIDLTKYKLDEDLHELMLQKGFVIGDADQRKKRCNIWKNNSFCKKYPNYMHTYCEVACHKVEL
jgi:hypothetical protein